MSLPTIPDPLDQLPHFGEQRAVFCGEPLELGRGAAVAGGEVGSGTAQHDGPPVPCSSSGNSVDTFSGTNLTQRKPENGSACDNRTGSAPLNAHQLGQSQCDAARCGDNNRTPADSAAHITNFVAQPDTVMCLAWHFTGDCLRDGRLIPADGETLRHDEELTLCERGLHASERLIDALQYARGATLCRVRCGGTILRDRDQLVCSERTIVWRIDATDLLMRFARQCALDVIHLWSAPDVVRRYLEIGDPKLRAAAGAAARAAAWDAAGAAARVVQNKRLTAMAKTAHAAERERLP